MDKQFRCVLFLILQFLSCSNFESGKAFFAKVIGVKDGDTIEVLYSGESITIRLLDIDCPEKKQAFGNKAKQFTSQMCFNKEVKIATNGRDRYKRILATVYIDERCLNEELLKEGLAWHYVKYSKNKEYSHLEMSARQNRKGLWNDDNPIAPWEFRQVKK